MTNGTELPKSGHCAVHLDNCIINFGGKVTSNLSNLYTEENM